MSESVKEEHVPMQGTAAELARAWEAHLVANQASGQTFLPHKEYIGLADPSGELFYVEGDQVQCRQAPDPQSSEMTPAEFTAEQVVRQWYGGSVAAYLALNTSAEPNSSNATRTSDPR